MLYCVSMRVNLHVGITSYRPEILYYSPVAILLLSKSCTVSAIYIVYIDLRFHEPVKVKLFKKIKTV